MNSQRLFCSQTTGMKCLFRRDMMDDALMRPGRLEVQIEIGLPKVKINIYYIRLSETEVLLHLTKTVEQ